MTLIVYPIRLVNNVIETVAEQPKKPYNELFGFSSWRTILWGHTILADLNCKILPTLANNAEVCAIEEDLEWLEDDTYTVLANLDKIVAAVDHQVEKQNLEFRMLNLLEAIRLARLYGTSGGVWVG